MSPPYREFHDDDMGKPPSCQYYAQVRRIMISLRCAALRKNRRSHRESN